MTTKLYLKFQHINMDEFSFHADYTLTGLAFKDCSGYHSSEALG